MPIWEYSVSEAADNSCFWIFHTFLFMVYNYVFFFLSFGDFRQFPVVHFWVRPLDTLVRDPSTIIIFRGQCIEAQCHIACTACTPALASYPGPNPIFKSGCLQCVSYMPEKSLKTKDNSNHSDGKHWVVSPYI